MNILSLFDGMSCGRIAIEKSGIKVDKYFASEIDKNAIKVSQHNYPDIIRLGDVTKVSYKDGVLYSEKGEWNVGKIDLLLAGSPCFVAGTSVITERGYKCIEDVVVGDVVLTHNNNWKPVLRVGGKMVFNTYSIKAQGVLPTTTTAEHPYFVRSCKRQGKKNVRTFSDPVWKPVNEVVVGDYVGIPIIQQQENLHNLTEDEAFILGRYIADGHTRKDFRVSEGRSEHRYWQLILSIGSHKLQEFKNRIPAGYSCYEHSNSTHRVVFSSKRLVMLAESMCGIGAENKEISAEMLKLPTCVLRNLVEGILSGDGSERDGVFRLTTVSKNLLQSLQLAIAKVYGVIGSVEFTKRQSTTVIEGRVVNQKDTYTISFRKDVKKNSHFRQIDNHIWTPVKSVDFLGELLSVFNLEVECDNSYTANNAVVHNCQGFSMAGKQLAFDDERSKLYFEFERILGEIIAENPNAKFILENVKMKQEYKDVISDRLGIAPIAINSNLVSAQNRYRLYWTNILGVQLPEDMGVYLEDILETDVDEKYYVKAGRLEWLKTFGEVKEKDGYVAFNPKKAKCLTVLREPSWNCTYILQWPHGSNNGGIRALDGKCPALTTSSWPANNLLLQEGVVRKLTPIECERLQTVPDNYTACVSDTQRYKMLGNGWTVDVVAHILKQSLLTNTISHYKI